MTRGSSAGARVLNITVPWRLGGRSDPCPPSPSAERHLQSCLCCVSLSGSLTSRPDVRVPAVFLFFSLASYAVACSSYVDSHTVRYDRYPEKPVQNGCAAERSSLHNTDGERRLHSGRTDPIPHLSARFLPAVVSASCCDMSAQWSRVVGCKTLNRYRDAGIAR
eukprot:6146455-Prymnesium_polylepis.3